MWEAFGNLTQPRADDAAKRSQGSDQNYGPPNPVYKRGGKRGAGRAAASAGGRAGGAGALTQEEEAQAEDASRSLIEQAEAAEREAPEAAGLLRAAR